MIDYVADPFIVKSGATYYMFFEIYKDAGLTVTIGYATSSDGLVWTWGAEVLNTTVTGAIHLSYPQVISVDGDWYMLPTSSNDSITLYKATTFPTVWTRWDVLISGNWGPRDATIFQYDGVFYILVYDTNNVTCRLYYSDTLYGTNAWSEHPSSPILSGARNSRPAGRPIVRAASVDVFLQDSVTTYGNKTRIYKLTDLSKTTVTVTELAGSPVLDASGSGWNSHGMHTLDRVNDTLSIVDGKTKDGNNEDVFSIGVYRDVP